MGDGSKHLAEVFAIERLATHDTLIENHTQGPHVRTGIHVLFAVHLLWRHVERCSHHRPGLCNGGRLRVGHHRLRQTEIDNLDLGGALVRAREKDVLGL